jgi:hypothetical protein
MISSTHIGTNVGSDEDDDDDDDDGDETETEERLQQLAHLNLNDPCSDRISLHSFSSASSGVSWDSNNSDPPLSPNIHDHWDLQCNIADVDDE